MGRFRIQVLLNVNTWSTRLNKPKKDQYSDSSTHWTLVSLNFTLANFGIKLNYDEIKTALADLCFSKITKTHCLCKMDDINCFEDLFESTPGYKKLVLIMFSIKKDVDISQEDGYLKNDNDCLRLEFRSVVMQQNEDYLDFIKNEGEPIIEKSLNK